MRNSLLKRRAAAAAAAAVMTVSASVGSLGGTTVMLAGSGIMTSFAAETNVSFVQSAGYAEGAFAEWAPVSNATGYNVYCDGTKIDSMLIRQYAGYFRADVVGIKAGSHTIKVVPVINGSEDSSKAGQTTVTSIAHDRSGFGFVSGSSSGAYNDDGTLKSNATVIYVTNANKDSVTVTLPDKKGADATLTGVQNIITGLKSNTKVGPVCIRLIGNITDPSTLTKGDLYVDTVSCGLTVEGIGTDTTLNGFGLVMKNSSNVEVRNLGFMNCDSSEGDNCGLQQGNDHIWVHHCDFFYGDAGSDADQVKGDGALDTKTSTYITHSYNHFWDNGKCNLQGMKSEETTNYITYHHNWYDHSDSRHPRIRTCSVHCYNNYFDGNAKYGVGVTMGASCFVENNYFRNCKNPMMSSMQGTDALGDGTFSGETGGIIKACGNYITGAASYITYSQNSSSFDAYEVSSASQTVPSGVKTLSGGTTYNNFDTSSVMYSYTPDAAADVPAKVMANAGRVQGGDFKWTFDNSVDDESYAVNTALKSALVSYKDSILAIGSGFVNDSTPTPTVTTTVTPVVTTITTTAAQTTPTVTTTASSSSGTGTPVSGSNVIYASPSGGGDGKSVSSPTDVLTAIKNVQAGGYIYLLDGTYKYTSTIMIEESNSGSSGKYKTIAAYPGANVKFDFTGQAVDSSARGFVLDGSYWHFYGFTIANAGDNGMLLSGDNNIIEMMVFDNNQDTGLQLSRYNGSYTTVAQWPTNNYIKNCTSRNNCDDATMENADGFAAKLTCGEGNVFDGCIAYNNSDDGWDLYAKTETGPTGVVTIKNCIAFRNGFTENGRGYGDCDGNGFKLGGGGVGTRHIVQNCLAFENLNCGFTDNNNPEFGVLKDCTAYNNGVGGNGKANYFVYRCSDSADIQNILTYYNTSKVSNTGAAGIKLANDKFKGVMKNTLYYNSKYYYNSGSTTCDGSSPKVGDVVTPAESDFITLSVPAMGTDFHKNWRNVDGSPKPAGFAETNGTYKSLGYHMSSGVAQTATPDVYAGGTDPVQTTTGGGQTTTQQTTTTTAAGTQTPVAGAQVHDFTLNGTNSSFYTISGNLSTSKGTVNYDGKTLTQCLKIETATSITFNSTGSGTLTLVFVEAAATIKVDGTKYTSSGDGIITVALSAGQHTITKADTANLFYMVYSESGAPATTTSTAASTTSTTAATTTTAAATSVTESATTTVTETAPVQSTSTGDEPEASLYGDANDDGEVNMADAVYIMRVNADPDSFRFTAKGKANADVYAHGDGVSNMDALAIQWLEAGLVDTLPTEGI